MPTASTPRRPAPLPPEILVSDATTGPTVSRRAVLEAGGTLWRTLDQGVFATGAGPASNAWSHGGGTLHLVRTATLAAHAQDSQPWLLQVTPTGIDLRADLRRNLGTIDPLLREMRLSLGCALENLLLAAAPHGYSPVLTLLPNPGDPTHVATRTLRRGPAPSSSPLRLYVHTAPGAGARLRGEGRPLRQTVRLHAGPASRPAHEREREGHR